MTKGSPKKSGMVGHLINFKPSDWTDVKEAARISGADDVSSYVRDAVRKAARAEIRKAGKTPATG